MIDVVVPALVAQNPKDAEPDAIDRALTKHGLAPPRAPPPLLPQLSCDVQLPLPL